MFPRRVLKQPVQFWEFRTLIKGNIGKISGRGASILAGESRGPRGHHMPGARPGPRTPHPEHRDRPGSLPAGSRPRRVPRLCGQPFSLEGAAGSRRAGSFKPPSPHRQPRVPAVRHRHRAAAGGGGGRGAEPLVTRPARSTARGGEDPPGEGGPGGGGDRGTQAPWSGSVPAGSWQQHAGLGARCRSPSYRHSRPRGPRPDSSTAGEEQGWREGAGAQVGVGRAAYLYLRGEPGGVGGPGRGGKGRGRGRGKGEPLCGVASEPLAPPPRPPPPFRFTQTNKMAAVTARLFRPPKSSVQIGRMFTVKNALVRLRGPPAPQTGRRRRADHFLVSGPPACWPRSGRKGSYRSCAGRPSPHTAHAPCWPVP